MQNISAWFQKSNNGVLLSFEVSIGVTKEVFNRFHSKVVLLNVSAIFLHDMINFEIYTFPFSNVRNFQLQSIVQFFLS